MESKKGDKKEKRVSFASEVEVIEYDSIIYEDSDEEVTADLTFGTKRVSDSFFNDSGYDKTQEILGLKPTKPKKKPRRKPGPDKVYYEPLKIYEYDRNGEKRVSISGDVDYKRDVRYYETRDVYVPYNGKLKGIFVNGDEPIEDSDDNEEYFDEKTGAYFHNKLIFDDVEVDKKVPVINVDKDVHQKDDMVSDDKFDNSNIHQEGDLAPKIIDNNFIEQNINNLIHSEDKNELDIIQEDDVEECIYNKEEVINENLDNNGNIASEFENDNEQHLNVEELIYNPTNQPEVVDPAVFRNYQSHQTIMAEISEAPVEQEASVIENPLNNPSDYDIPEETPFPEYSFRSSGLVSDRVKMFEGFGSTVPLYRNTDYSENLAASSTSISSRLNHLDRQTHLNEVQELLENGEDNNNKPSFMKNEEIDIQQNDEVEQNNDETNTEDRSELYVDSRTHMFQLKNSSQNTVNLLNAQSNEIRDDVGEEISSSVKKYRKTSHEDGTDSYLSYNRIRSENSQNLNDAHFEDNRYRENVATQENMSCISNDTVYINELINTQDLRKLLPQNSEEEVKLFELLMKKGIRFLDDLALATTRKSTLPPTFQEIEKAKIEYYKSFLSPRIKFFDQFSEDLKLELNAQQQQIKEIEGDVDVKNTIIEDPDSLKKLKTLKADSRNKSKIEWYEVRTKKELEFNSGMITTKSKLNEVCNIKTKELKKKEQVIERLSTDNSDLENEAMEVKSSMKDLADSADKKLEHLENTCEQQEKLIENYQNDLNALNTKKDVEEAKKSKTEEEIDEIHGEVDELEKALRGISISDEELTKVRKFFDLYTFLVSLKLSNFTNREVKMNYQDYEITFYFGKDRIVKNVNVIYLKDLDNVSSFGLTCLNIINTPLKNAVLEFFKRVSILNELSKEVALIRKTFKASMSTCDEELRLKVYVDNASTLKTEELQVVICKNFDCSVYLNDNGYMYNLANHKGIILDHLET